FSFSFSFSFSLSLSARLLWCLWSLLGESVGAAAGSLVGSVGAGVKVREKRERRGQERMARESPGVAHSPDVSKASIAAFRSVAAFIDAVRLNAGTSWAGSFLDRRRGLTGGSSE